MDLPRNAIDRALVVCSGPSAAGIDWAEVPEHLPIIAVNMTLYDLPRCDYWWSCDAALIRDIEPVHPCQYACCDPRFGVGRLPPTAWQCSKQDGFCNQDSGLDAILLAVLLGARRIAVVGFDCTGSETWTSRPSTPSPTFLKCGRLGIANAAAAAVVTGHAGVEVRNGSPESRCTAWPRCTPAEAIDWVAAR